MKARYKIGLTTMSSHKAKLGLCLFLMAVTGLVWFLCSVRPHAAGPFAVHALTIRAIEADGTLDATIDGHHLGSVAALKDYLRNLPKHSFVKSLSPTSFSGVDDFGKRLLELYKELEVICAEREIVFDFRIALG